MDFEREKRGNGHTRLSSKEVVCEFLEDPVHEAHGDPAAIRTHHPKDEDHHKDTAAQWHQPRLPRIQHVGPQQRKAADS